MKKNLFYALGIIGIIACSSSVNLVKAQESNVLQEVKLNPKDGFNELRKLVVQKFDFNTPNLSEGEAVSTVRFSINEKGKIDNVNVDGKNEVVNQELENVMNSLLYKFTSVDNNATTFSFPVKVYIASK